MSVPLTNAGQHPLLLLLEKRRTPQVKLAAAIGVTPQSLNKWLRLCRADPAFKLPALRAKLIATFFRVNPALLRPDLF